MTIETYNQAMPLVNEIKELEAVKQDFNNCFKICTDKDCWINNFTVLDFKDIKDFIVQKIDKTISFKKTQLQKIQ